MREQRRYSGGAESFSQEANLSPGCKGGIFRFPKGLAIGNIFLTFVKKRLINRMFVVSSNTVKKIINYNK